MKKTILLLSALSLGTAGVEAQFDNSASVARDIYQSPAWQRAFAGYWGVEAAVEPKVEERDREILGQISTELQKDSDEGVRNAANIIEGYIAQQRKDPEVKPSASVLFIAGTLNQRLAELQEGEAARKPYQTKAVDYLSSAVDAYDGKYLRAHKNLANLLFRMGENQRAKGHFQKAIQLGDNDAITYGLLGAIYMEEDRYVSAESALRRSLLINPEIREFRQILGNALYFQERFNEAKELFGELLLEKPNNADYWKLQANCFISLDDLDEATRNLEIVRMMGQADPQSLLLLGDVYMNKEMVDDAAEAYLDAVRKGASIEAFPAYISAASTLNSYEAYDHSIALLDQVKSNLGDKVSAEQEIEMLALRSEVNIARGMPGEAVQNLEEILRRDPFNSRALLSLARYYADLQPDAGLSESDARVTLSEYQSRAINYFERAENLSDQRARRNALIGHAQLMVQKNELQEAIDLLEEAQALEYSENIARYLEQIQAANRARRR